jgi:hypothetical protein
LLAGPDHSQAARLVQEPRPQAALAAESSFGYADSMMKNIAIILICLTLAACGNCSAEGNNDDSAGRCWFFSRSL